MEWKLGNVRQIVVSTVLILLVGFATQYKPVSNVHLVVTILIALLHGYAAYQWNHGRLAENKVNPSKIYLLAFAVNAIISFAMSWWFSGIVWIYNLCIYIAVQTPKKIKEGETSNV